MHINRLLCVITIALILILYTWGNWRSSQLIIYPVTYITKRLYNLCRKTEQQEKETSKIYEDMEQVVQLEREQMHEKVRKSILTSSIHNFYVCYAKGILENNSFK